jgi:hypothetical protein
LTRLLMVMAGISLVEGKEPRRHATPGPGVVNVSPEPGVSW